ncbi:hypothetical protein E4T56_gene2234 [Termitomyces sp. T112]|nr:hypothetical protein E4T56_gene2234 [Termitomyces sp. T112]
MLQGPLHSSANALPTTAPSARTPAPTLIGAPQASVPIHLVLRHAWPTPHQGECSADGLSPNGSVSVGGPHACPTASMNLSGVMSTWATCNASRTAITCPKLKLGLEEHPANAEAGSTGTAPWDKALKGPATMADNSVKLNQP